MVRRLVAGFWTNSWRLWKIRQLTVNSSDRMVTFRQIRIIGTMCDSTVGLYPVCWMLCHFFSLCRFTSCSPYESILSSMTKCGAVRRTVLCCLTLNLDDDDDRDASSNITAYCGPGGWAVKRPAMKAPIIRYDLTQYRTRWDLDSGWRAAQGNSDRACPRDTNISTTGWSSPWRWNYWMVGDLTWLLRWTSSYLQWVWQDCSVSLFSLLPQRTLYVV